MHILFLDDSTSRHKIFKQHSIGCIVDHVYSADECIEALRKNAENYDLLMLDHDLDVRLQNVLSTDPEEKDGRYVVRWMIESETIKKVKGTIVVHSLNSVAAGYMVSMCKSAGFDDAHTLPFAWECFRKTENGCQFVKMDYGKISEYL